VNYYIPAALRDLGLRVGFGHDGETCPNPRPGRLEAITKSGIKTVAVDFCCCRSAYDDEGQIKAHGWWPMRGNFVLAVRREILLPVDPDAADSSESGSSDSDTEASETVSSTSE
jgi:hypothetical protein